MTTGNIKHCQKYRIRVGHFVSEAGSKSSGFSLPLLGKSSFRYYQLRFGGYSWVKAFPLERWVKKYFSRKGAKAQSAAAFLEVERLSGVRRLVGALAAAGSIQKIYVLTTYMSGTILLLIIYRRRCDG